MATSAAMDPSHGRVRPAVSTNEPTPRQLCPLVHVIDVGVIRELTDAPGGVASTRAVLGVPALVATAMPTVRPATSICVPRPTHTLAEVHRSAVSVACGLLAAEVGTATNRAELVAPEMVVHVGRRFPVASRALPTMVQMVGC